MCHHQWISTGARWCHCHLAQGANSQLECARLGDNSEVAFETISLPGVHPCPMSQLSIWWIPEVTPTTSYICGEERNKLRTQKCLSDLARK